MCWMKRKERGEKIDSYLLVGASDHRLLLSELCLGRKGTHTRFRQLVHEFFNQCVSALCLCVKYEPSPSSPWSWAKVFTQHHSPFSCIHLISTTWVLAFLPEPFWPSVPGRWAVVSTSWFICHPDLEWDRLQTNVFLSFVCIDGCGLDFKCRRTTDRRPVRHGSLQWEILQFSLF